MINNIGPTSFSPCTKLGPAEMPTTAMNIFKPTLFSTHKEDSGICLGQNGSQYSYNGGQEPYQQPAKGNGNGFAIAGFVLSLVSILACCLYYVAIPCAVLAIIFSVLGRKSAYRGLAIAGIVIGIVGLAITLMLLAFAASLVNSGDYYEYMKWLEEYME